MLNYYFGHELYIASLVMLAAVGINLILLFFVPWSRRTFGYTLLLLGIILVLNMVRYQYQLAVFGSRAEGKVVDLVAALAGTQNMNDRDPDTVTYYPVVRFVTADGQPVQFRSVQDVNEGIYTVGESLNVRYISQNPAFAEIDSWLSLWRPMLLGSLFDWVVCAAGVLLIRKFGRNRPALSR